MLSAEGISVYRFHYSLISLPSLGGRIPLILFGRGEWIRTTGLLVPNQALYQAEPRPEIADCFRLSDVPKHP